MLVFCMAYMLEGSHLVVLVCVCVCVVSGVGYNALQAHEQPEEGQLPQGQQHQ